MSIRLMWPFARVASSDATDMEILAREGIGLAEFANPETRLRHRVAIELLERAVDRTGDPTLGLRAANSLEPAEFDVIDHVARSCENLREAILCTGRYFHLLNGAAQITLEEQGSWGTWRWSVTDGVTQPPAANDFVIASAVLFGNRYTGVEEPEIEVHLAHPEPSYAAEYTWLAKRPIRFGMPCNAVVIPKRRLEQPMLRADRALRRAFELQAKAQCERLRADDGIATRVREVALAQIPHGDSSMEFIARKLGMSVATLRRRLEDEETSHREVLDQLRCDLARDYLKNGQIAISEVAFLLGFSHVTAMHKAFKRWTGGMTPTEYRAQQQQAQVGASGPGAAAWARMGGAK